MDEEEEAPLAGGSRVDLTDDPDVRRIDTAMGVVARAIEALREGRAGDGGAQAAAEVASACDTLWRRWRAEGR